MDYDYDHLGEGIDRLQRALSPHMRQAESAMDDAAYPDWLVRGLDLEDTVWGFPEAHETGHLDRVKSAVAVCAGIRALDARILTASEAMVLAMGLEDHLRQECDAMERYMGIHTPHEVLHPAPEPEPAPAPRF